LQVIDCGSANTVKGRDVPGLYGTSPENGRPRRNSPSGQGTDYGVDSNNAEEAGGSGRLEARKAQGMLDGQHPGDQCDEIWAFVSRWRRHTALAHCRASNPTGCSLVRALPRREARNDREGQRFRCGIMAVPRGWARPISNRLGCRRVGHLVYPYTSRIIYK
jgi:hypothetical protein